MVDNGSLKIHFSEVDENMTIVFRRFNLKDRRILRVMYFCAIFLIEISFWMFFASCSLVNWKLWWFFKENLIKNILNGFQKWNGYSHKLKKVLNDTLRILQMDWINKNWNQK